MISALERICNFMAACCCLFNVDWDEDFQDDEYVIATRRERIHAV